MASPIKVLLGLRATERVTSTISSLPASGYILLPGGNVWNSYRNINRQMRKPGCVLVNVEGLTDKQITELRDKAREHWVSGVFLQGSSAAHAVHLLKATNLTLGYRVSLADENPMNSVAETIAAGCTRLLIEPSDVEATQFLQALQAAKLAPEVFYGIRPHDEASVERELAKLPKGVHVYADCSGLSESNICLLMQKLKLMDKKA